MKLKVLIKGRSKRVLEISEGVVNNKRIWIVEDPSAKLNEKKLKLQNFGRLDPEDLVTVTDEEFIKETKNKLLVAKSLKSEEARQILFRGIQHLWKKKYWFSTWKQIF